MSELISSLNPNVILDNSIEFRKIKADGKVLSDNNYTTAEKEKLAGLNNYDDTAITTAIANIEDKIPSEASSTNKLIDEAAVHNIRVTLENSIATKANTDDIKESGLIAGVATAGNGYNIKIDWSLNLAKENNIDPAYRGQVNIGASCTTSNAWAYAEGSSNTASGNASHAEGAHNTASSNASHAEGGYNTASGVRSHAEGMYNVASGQVSHAEGGHNTASGTVSHTEGESNVASGYASHAEGLFNIASGTASHIGGELNVASGYASHAEGSCTVASGMYSSTAIGSWVITLKLTGDANATSYTCNNLSNISIDNPDCSSYILGPDNYSYVVFVNDKGINPVKIISVDTLTGIIKVESTLSADVALSDTVCGVSETIARGDYSFATRGVAVGNSSWIVNRGGFAKGTASFVGGNLNSAFNNCEVAFGRLNKSIESSDSAVATIATIGIGTDKNNRKNATEIKQNGDAYIIGIGGYDGTNPEADGIKTVQGVIEDINTQIKTVDDKVVALETTNTELRNTISTLEARIAELERKMSEITIVE